MIEQKTLNILEFDAVLQAVAAYAVSETAKSELLRLYPADGLPEVDRLLQLTEEAYIVRHRYNRNPVMAIDDCLQSIEKSKIGAALQASELLRIARLLRAARIAQSTIFDCGDDVSFLKEAVTCLRPDRVLEDDIGRCIVSESEIKDDASPLLKNIRRKIAAAHNHIKNRLNEYVRNDTKHLQDALVTVREGRFVLPVKSENRSAIPGLVHDTSGSGATVYVEPFPIVELNNALRVLQAEEREEIERILAALSQRVGEQADRLVLCQEQCVMIDIIFAKMAYSVSISGIRPILNTDGVLNLKNARHPLLAKDTVVPVSLRVGDDFRILVITGPNTGGKTVCLKTAGLLCAMTYIGLLIPCEAQSQIAVFDSIFCDIGDEQSIAQSLSTFSSHVVNLVSITDSVTKNSLVLLDELGGGTDPHEGAALAQGILQYLELVQAKGIITTHYGELKEYALISEALMNASMQFDEQTLRPTYKIITGVPGVSNALKIAETLGLNDYILRQARGCLQNETVQFERVLESAERIKAQAVAELEEAERYKGECATLRRQLDAETQALQAKLDRINSNAKAETLRLVGVAREEADDIIAQMKLLLRQSDEAALLEARKLRNRLEDMRYIQEERPIVSFEPMPRSAIRPGEHVFVRSVQADGIVQSVPNKKDEVTVTVGAIKMNVRIADLGRCAKPKKASAVKNKPVQKSTDAEKGVVEIKVLGLTVSEAVECIEPYLVDISQNNNRILKIVHGKGSGSLGKGIQQYLRRSPLVASFRYGQYGEGETGVTFVEVK